MAKNKRRYNAKARKTNLNCKPESPQKEQLMREQGSDKAGDKNVLFVEEDAEYNTVLKPNPQIVDIAKKGKSVKEVKENKVLSKKKRKYLDKILEKKKKKAKVLHVYPPSRLQVSLVMSLGPRWNPSKEQIIPPLTLMHYFIFVLISMPRGEVIQPLSDLCSKGYSSLDFDKI